MNFLARLSIIEILLMLDITDHVNLCRLISLSVWSTAMYPSPHVKDVNIR